MKKILISLNCFLLIMLHAHPQDGTLDLSFGNNGISLIQGYYNAHLKNNQAIQTDGKILAGVITYPGDVIIFRFNSNGSLDNEFSNDGKFEIGLELNVPIIGMSDIFDIEIQADGKIIVLFSLGTNKSILRLTSNGMLDNGFGNNGIVITDFAFSFNYTTLIIQESGKIIILENIYDDDVSNGYGVIQRLNSDGTSDITFGINSKVILETTIFLFLGVKKGNDNSLIYCEVLINQSNTERRLLVKQLYENGARSILFDVNWPISAGIGVGGFVIKNNKLYLGGSYSNNVLNTNDAALFCYNSNGELDTEFDDDGIKILISDFNGYSKFVNQIQIQDDGYFLLSGHYIPDFDIYDNNRFFIKLKPDGSHDPNFNGNGIFELNSIQDPNTAITYSGINSGEIFIQADGKILLYGIHYTLDDGAVGFHLLRLHNSVISCHESSLSATISDAFAITPGGNLNTVYIGYHPASSITLTATPSGGNAPYSYNWSTVPAQSTQQITVSPAIPGTYNYNVTVTDATGCTAQFSKTIKAVNIISGQNLDKVYICHRDLKGKWTTLSVLQGSVANHLAHGDYLGPCNTNSSNSEILTRVANETGGQEIIPKGFKIYPNPATHFLYVQWSIKNTSHSYIRILNAEGKTVKTFTTQGAVNQQRISLNGLAKGVYMLVLKTGSDQQVSKFVIQ